MDSEATMKNLMEQLHHLNQHTATSLLQTPQAPAQQAVSAEQIAAIVETQIKRAMPQLMTIVQSLDNFFEKALPAAELAAFKAYRDQGAPGLKELLESTDLHPVAQLLWDEIKTNAVKLMENAK